MIPIGTLCLVLGARKGQDAYGRFMHGDQFNGCTGTIDSHRAITRRTHGLTFPDGRAVWIDPKFLRPIAPPGNPDEIKQPQEDFA